MKRDRLERLEELERVLRGLLVVFFVLFSLPVFVSFLILIAAVLNSAHRSAATIFPLDSYWAHLLSIGFRTSPIPGVAFLVYCVVNRLRYRPLEHRLAFVAFSLLCLVVFVYAPSRQYSHNRANPVGLTQEKQKETVYAIPRSSDIIRVEGVPVAKPLSDQGDADPSPPKKVYAEFYP
jgi:hypothetical protein